MLSIAQIRQTLLHKERSATEIDQEYLDRIDRLEPKLNSFSDCYTRSGDRLNLNP